MVFVERLLLSRSDNFVQCIWQISRHLKSLTIGIDQCELLHHAPSGIQMMRGPVQKQILKAHISAILQKPFIQNMDNFITKIFIFELNADEFNFEIIKEICFVSFEIEPFQKNGVAIRSFIHSSDSIVYTMVFVLPEKISKMFSNIKT